MDTARLLQLNKVHLRVLLQYALSKFHHNIYVNLSEIFSVILEGVTESASLW